jgi:hypothetical protein
VLDGFLKNSAAPASAGAPSPQLSFCGQASSSTFLANGSVIDLTSRLRHARRRDGGLRRSDDRAKATSIENRKSKIENLVTVIDKCGQATKGVWWMSWHREAMKDAVACDKLREAGKRASIRRFPNAETRRSNPPSLPAECIGRVERTQGTETSKYLEEKKKTLIP